MWQKCVEPNAENSGLKCFAGPLAACSNPARGFKLHTFHLKTININTETLGRQLLVALDAICDATKTSHSSTMRVGRMLDHHAMEELRAQ